MTDHAPTDSTLRNVKAANRKLADLTARVKAIEKAFKDVWFMGALVNQLEARIQKLEHKVKATHP